MTLLRRLVPRSLFGRNLLLIVALILLAEIGNGLVFRQTIQEPRAARMAEIARMQIETVRAALLLAPADQRAALLADLLAKHQGADDAGIAVSRVTMIDQTPATLTEPKRVAINIFMQRLKERLGPEYKVGWQAQPEQRLWIATRVDNVDYWFGIDAGVFVGSNATLFIVISLCAALLAALGATLIQRRINRPLIALAAAAGEIGHGHSAPLATDGLPTEIAQVAESFNRMASELETAERERALMLAGVSHDLRTPLAKLRLAVAILADGREPELIEGMERNIAAADAIIGQFIDFARVGTEEPVRLCNVNEIVDDVARLSDPANVSRSLGTVAPVTCRPLALRRAISNLVENALRYGAAPGAAPAVSIATAQVGSHIAIRVCDHGPGIPPEHIARLRQPFARLDESRSNTPGAGLGLAIVERIARLHHGQFTLANRPEGGLEATILLPFQADDGKP